MMKPFARFLSLLLVLMLFGSFALAADETVFREITTDVVEEIPETIQQVLDLAYEEWQAADAQELKRKNKYTEWRNNSEWGWCGGFVTWCMLQLDIPQQEKNKTPNEEVPGLVHVKEAGQGKLYDGYGRMNRLTKVPQKGFVVVFGNGKQFGDVGVTKAYHVGLVYDVEKLSEGKYRITTIEGNVSSPGDATHKKAAHTIRMYVRDYDMNAEKLKQDLSLVPENERTQEETALFSYGWTYENDGLYISAFLMPWIPEE